MTGLTLPALRRMPVPRGYAADIAVAVAVTAFQLAFIRATLAWHQHQQPSAGVPGVTGYLLLAASGLALIGRRRFPVAVLGVALATTLAADALGAGAWFAVIVAFVSADVARRRAAAIASLVIGYVVTFWPPWRIGQAGHGSVEVAVGVAGWLVVLLAVAELIRMRGQRVAAAERSRADQLRRRASEERVLIARDLHDVLAHNISVINVQANTALHLMDRQPERAREALTSIHEVSKQALAELRTVLGVLRADGDTAPRAPSPGLAQLAELVSAVGAAGLRARVAVQGEPRELPGDVDLAGYRIVQEALTNCARHSASRSADVVVRYQPDGVLVQVDDAGPAQQRLPGSDRGPTGTGNGITGMAERAEAIGGTLSAGVRPDGGFRVVAWLPFAGESAR
ncbi:MAG TPA: sensor histidine kinase [Streptosporangiaceae bacterium]|nr:sensor histidine kinase [Streptosporangiaceae bacterium]